MRRRSAAARRRRPSGVSRWKRNDANAGLSRRSTKRSTGSRVEKP